jgi:MFS family permease
MIPLIPDTWELFYWIAAALIGVISFGIGMAGVFTARSEITGRYKQDDARAILGFLVLGPLLAPVWLPVALLAGLGFTGWTVWKVNKDAHVLEIIPDLVKQQQMATKYRELESQNARLTNALEAKVMTDD